MGVKSTKHLIANEAIEKFINLRMQAMRKELKAVAVAMSRVELEDELERLNDKANDGEGFENYIIDDWE